MTHLFHRRDFLRSAAALAATAAIGRADGEKRPKVAAVFTEFTYRSHAHVILENFLEPYYFNGQVTDSGCDVVSFFGDQFPAGRDMGRDVAKQYKIPVFPTIAEALTLGGKELAVDAVLSIGEHGTYPTNAKGQREYPRKRFFDEIAAVMRKSGRAVPVFNDKHLSYRWDWAKAMYDTARELKMPLMAGSSVPLAQRIPPLELPAGAKVTEAIATHGGGLDSYDFHALEVLQSMVESRAGGETGVARVQYLTTDGLRKAAESRQWSPDILQAAWDAEDRKAGKPTLEKFWESKPWGVMVHYRDGLRGLALKVSGDGTRWHFGCRVAGEAKPLVTNFYVGPWRNRCLFKALSHAIQTHFRQGRPPYPIERTLLTTGIVEAVVESHARGDSTYETPHLAIKYTATDYRAMREMGGSWKIVTEETEEAKGIDRLGKPVPPFPPAGTEGGFNPIRKG
ncbi:MAG: hypothetical protein U0746_11145 [Gemmataceae bacterium]